jgi:hypothetical protein
MALKKGTNSYATVAEADSYFEDRLDAAAWSLASEEQREKALVTATTVIDTMRWLGYVTDDEQRLAFPRVGRYFDDKLGTEVQMDSSEVPERILIGLFEQAYHLLNSEGILDEVGTLDSLGVGSISIDIKREAALIPPIVRKVVRPLLRTAGVLTWWRAN